MARSTQQIIEDIRLLRQELLLAGKAATQLTASIESTARTAINVRQFGPGQARPLSVERTVTRISRTLEQGDPIGSVQSLGKDARVRIAGVFRDIFRDLEYQLSQIRGAASVTGASTTGGARFIPPTHTGLNMNQVTARTINRDYWGRGVPIPGKKDEFRGGSVYRDVEKQAGAGVAENLRPDINKLITGYTVAGKALREVNVKTKELANNTTRVTATFRDENGVLDKHSFLVRKVGDSYDRLSNAQQRISTTQRKNLQAAQGGVFGKARQFGYTDEDLYQVREDPTTRIKTFDFRRVEEGTGVIRKASLAVNKFGEVLVDTQKRFRSFGDAIVRDTVEVLKWSIAVGVVYGTIQKLQEAIQTAIDNQSKLVDINIALGRSQQSLNSIFENAARISQQTGESLNGVLDGYVQAYRAAGSARTEMEKTSIANKFLTDSLILSKLSSLDQAEALDILSGALKQLQKDGEGTDQMFARSAELLDKWVVTTRNANVDLATLATAFSVTSESADNAGLSMEELNGVIAVLAEKLGALSPKEAGNTVRALIGGIYSESASKALAEYGVAVTDASGKTRDFLDIMKQIYDLNQAGLISDDQLNKLALTLGGGVRRGQQYLAFLTSIGQVYSLVEKQTDSAGAAQDALGQKLNTVETSITNLSNSFIELAQSLGNEGGVLSLMQSFLEVATSLVEVLNGITKAAGTAGPALVAVLAGMAYFSGENKGARLQGLQSFLGGVGRRTQTVAGEGGDFTTQQVQRQSAGMGAYNFLTGGTFASKAAIGGLTSLMPALANAGKGDYEEATANIAGGILGALATGGSPIGALIGSAMAESLTRNLEEWFDTSQDTAEAFFSGALGKAIENARNAPLEEGSVTTSQEGQTTREQEIYKEIFKLTGRGEGLGRFGSGATAGIVNTLSQVFTPILTMFTGKQQTPLSLTQEDVATVAAFQKNPEKTAQLIQELVDIQKENERKASGGAVSSTGIAVERRISTANEHFFEQYAKEISKKLLQDVITGEITAKQAETTRGRIPKVAASAVQLQATAGETFQGLVGLETQQESLEKLMDILLTAPEDATTQLAAMNGEINELAKSIYDAKGGAVEYGDGTITTAKATELLTQKTQELAGALKGLYLEHQRASIKIPTVLDYTDVTKAEAAPMITKAKEDMRTELRTVLPDISDTDLEAYISTFEPVWLKLKDGYEQVFEIDPKYLDEARDFFKEVGKIASDTLDFTFFDAEKFNIARQYYQGTKSRLEEKGYVSKEEPQLVVMDDGSIQNLTYDNKIMSLLMSQLVEISRKQLDGIYNLPTEASFYIPAQAAAYFPDGGGGGYNEAPLGLLGEKGGDIGTGPGTEASVAAGGTANYSRFLEEEEKRLKAEAQLAVANAQTAPTNTGDFSWLNNWMKENERRNPIPEEKETNFDWLEEYDQERSRDRNRTRVSEAEYSTYYNRDVPRTQEIPSIQEGETSFLKNMIDSLSALSKQSMNFKLSLSSSTNLMLDGRVVANAIKRYLSDDMLTAAQSTYTKNSVI